MSRLRVGELFVLGFRGEAVPDWLREFERRFGLGGVILFDYDCQKKAYGNNIRSPDQVRALCQEISGFVSRPLILVDQEGGKVRRLKEALGFAPLPSQKKFNLLPASEQRALVTRAFKEMRALGFHYDLAPVIDLDFNPANPDIGAIERSYSRDANQVRANTGLLSDCAQEARLGLCLKHYPGLGAATVNSHESLTDLSGTIDAEQLALFYELGASTFGTSLLLSHGVVREWDALNPVSLSPAAVARLRAELPEALLMTDDLQMQALQKLCGSGEASRRAVAAGVDWVLVGNNLMPEDEKAMDWAQNLAQAIDGDPSLRRNAEASLQRVRARKDLLCG